MLTRQELYILYDQGPQAVITLIEALYAELAATEPPIVRIQRSTIASQLEIIKKLQSRLQRLGQQLTHQQCRTFKLQQRLAELGREVAKDSHNSSLPPSSDSPKVKRTRSLRQKSDKKVGGQPHHRATTLRRSPHPDQIITHSPEECRGCKASLADSEVTASESRQVFDIPPVQIKVIEHRAEIKCCGSCGQLTKAQFPAGINAAVQYSQRVRSQVLYLHKYQLLPFARTAEAMKDLFGCALSPGTIHRIVRECSETLTRTEAQIKDAITTSAVIGADETGLRVAKQNQWIHVARTERLTHYAYSPKRGKEALDSIGILPAFTGTLVSDAYPSYSQYNQYKRGLCGAHLLRELVYIKETCSEQQQWTAPLAKLLIEIKRAGQRVRAAGGESITLEQQAKFFRRYDRITALAAKLNPATPPSQQQPRAKRQKIPKPIKPKNPATALVIRLRDKKEDILRFMTDLSVPFDNNGSERDIRMVKLVQKIGGCFRTSAGTEAFCRIRSYLSSARKQGHALLPALESAFSGYPITLFQ